MRAQLKPIHHMLTEYYIGVLDQLYAGFNTEATAHEADTLQFVETLTKLKSGEIDVKQIMVTDGAWEIVPKSMISPAPSSNNKKPLKEVKDAVPTGPS